MGEKVVIITGASRGLGRALALRFGRDGGKVLVNYKDKEEEARLTVEEVKREGGEAFAFRADVRDCRMVQLMVDSVLKRYGRVDVLINNAAAVKDQLLIKISPEDWDEVLGTNLTGAFNMIRAASKAMLRQRSGHIVNISSISGEKGRIGQASYSASKSALIGLTKAAARELGRYNIKVNAILPGLLLTGMVETSPSKVKKIGLKESILNRFSNIEIVVEFIYNLTEGDSVSGQVFNLDSRVF